jgi:hypothetical protein
MYKAQPGLSLLFSVTHGKTMSKDLFHEITLHFDNIQYLFADKEVYIQYSRGFTFAAG